MAKVKEKQYSLVVPNIVLDARWKEITLFFQKFFKSSKAFLRENGVCSLSHAMPKYLQSSAKRSWFPDSKRCQKPPTNLPQIGSKSQNSGSFHHNSCGSLMGPQDRVGHAECGTWAI